MARVCILLVLVVLCSKSALGQRARFSERSGRSPARAAAAVGALRENLHSARRLLGEIKDRQLRRELEVLLTRAAMNAEELEALFPHLSRTRGGRPISAGDFANLLKNLKDQSFDADKLQFIASFLKDRRIYCDQATQILKSFSFDEGRIKAAIALHPNVVDSENFYEVLKVLSFESSRKQVMEAVRKSAGQAAGPPR